ncbi:hypothetical protein ACNOYE_10750 [Nannocystaceae bacterium ST9]
MPVTLDWQAPATCPSEAEVLARVRARVPASTSATLSIRARVSADESSHRVELELRNAEGESMRSFAARDCETLTDAVVLVVAVTFDPVWLVEQLERERAPSEGPELEAPEPEAPEPEAPEPEAPESTRIDAPIELGLQLEPAAEPSPRVSLRVGLRAFGGGGYGPTRGAHGFVGGALALIGERWRVELGARWSAPRVVRRAEGAGGRFEAWSLGARGCFVPVARALEFPLCLGIEAGLVRGRGLESLPRVETASFPWVAGSVAQGLWWAPLDRLALGVELELVLPFTRGSFLVDEREVERIAGIGVRGLAGVELRLP